MATAIPYENTGTATVTAGQIAVVGQGTRWTRCRPNDQFFGRTGERNIVANITDDTHLDLLFPATIPQIAQGVAVLRTPDEVRAESVATEILQKLNDSSLLALAGAPAAPRKGIRFGPLSSAETFDFTDKAVDLAGKADEAAMRGFLGVAPKQISVSDTTAGAGLIVGAFGLGGDGMAIPGSNYNSAVVPGNYSGAGSAGINSPPGNAIYGPLTVTKRGTIIKQVAGYADTNNADETYTRYSVDNGATWNAWLRYATVFRGTWTPSIFPYSGSWGTSPTLDTAWYQVFNDKLVHFNVSFRAGSNIGSAAVAIVIGLPFTPATNHSVSGINFSSGIALTGAVQSSTGSIYLYTYNALFPVAANGFVAVTGSYLRA